jgi:ZIP family zinc transporter
MIDYVQLLLLGAIAGLTIFLGLPLALLQNVSIRKKGFLNALSMGILVFLISDVLANAWEPTKIAAKNAYAGAPTTAAAVTDLLALFIGLAIGLLGLAFYEQRYVRRITAALKQATLVQAVRKQDKLNGMASITQQGSQEQNSPSLIGSPYHLATMIAMSIGLHNFSEGLAVGQSYAQGVTSLAVVLIVGFGAHNTTEGFGIAGPLTGILEKPKISFLAKLGLIGGGPTFLGTIVGSLWVSELTYVLFLSLAAGALIYVTLLMYNSARRQSSNDLIMIGIFIGLLAGFLTNLIVSLGGA